MSPKIAVVGAGVSGLASAVRILGALPSAEVTVFADEFSPDTTSDVAAGFWVPHCLGDTPENLIRDWSSKTFDYIISLINSDAAKFTGACMVSGDQLTASESFTEPFWKDIVYNYRVLSQSEVSKYPGMRHGIHYTTVMLESRLYLQWLMKRIQRLGGKLRKRRVNSLEELVNENYVLIVNCSGVGAHTFVSDNHVVPVRGQIVRVQAPWIKQFLICEEEIFAYILPSSSFVVLGGVQKENDWSREVNTKDKQLIIQTCTKYMPTLKEASFDSDGVGLRPVRSQVRLELESLTSLGRTVPVVHNYGHGGSGFTLHWGCAEHVTMLVRQTLEEKHASKL